MVAGESPLGARRRLRLALRKARETKGLTQAQVADALDWSPSKVQRIESGEVAVSGSDLKASLDLFGVTDPKRIAQLIELARTSRRKAGRWWEEPRFRQNLTDATLQLLQFESEASAIRVFHPTLIPGVLQTPAYAEYILNFWKDELTEDERAVRFEVRMHRREFVLSRPDPPDYYLALDESVLSREVGGPRVMADQLHELINLIGESNVFVRILPFAAAANLAELGQFYLLELGDEENVVLYREAQLVDLVEEAPDRVKLYRGRFEQIWANALNEQATARLIEARAAAMISSLDQRRAEG